MPRRRNQNHSQDRRTDSGSGGAAGGGGNLPPGVLERMQAAARDPSTAFRPSTTVASMFAGSAASTAVHRLPSRTDRRHKEESAHIDRSTRGTWDHDGTHVQATLVPLTTDYHMIVERTGDRDAKKYSVNVKHSPTDARVIRLLTDDGRNFVLHEEDKDKWEHKGTTLLLKRVSGFKISKGNINICDKSGSVRVPLKYSGECALVEDEGAGCFGCSDGSTIDTLEKEPIARPGR